MGPDARGALGKPRLLERPLMLKLFRPGIRETPRHRLLAGLHLFESLTPKELRVVDSLLHERQYLAGEVIADQGDEGQALFLIQQGKVLICPQGDMEHPVAELETGNFFGELALLNDSPRLAQARALEDTVLLVLFRGDCLELIRTHATIGSKVCFALARHLGHRLRTVMEQAHMLGPW